MKRNFCLLIFIVFCNFNLFAQPDCRITFIYKGTISSESIKIIKVGLPTTPFLAGFISKEEKRAFDIFDLKDSAINQSQGSHLASDFCSSENAIINNFFKQPKDGYIIKVFDKIKWREVLIPLTSITFSVEVINREKKIVINLGNIKI